LKQAHRQRLVAHRFFPQAVFRMQVEQVPGGAAEGKHLRPLGKHLDLA
jgi:hypothetical protein